MTGEHELLEQILAELQALHEKVDQLSRAPRAPALIAALRETFGDSPFTASGVLSAAERCVALFDELVEHLDVEAPRHAQAVALGRLLARLDEIEIKRSSRGIHLYRVLRE